MAYRTILAAMSGGRATTSVAEAAFQLAKAFGSNVKGAHFRPDAMRVISTMSANVPVAAAGPLISDIEHRIESAAHWAKESFERSRRTYGLELAQKPCPGTSASWTEGTGDVPLLTADMARFSDLVVAGRSDHPHDHVYSELVESVLLHSGRPILLVPAKPPVTLGKRVMIGWNGSREVVRAIAVALPLLKAADVVLSVSIGTGLTDSDRLVEYLAWEGIEATRCQFPPGTGSDTGGQLLSAARDQSADLLITGGYSRAPWREYVFGGATKDLLETSLLPVFMSH